MMETPLATWRGRARRPSLRRARRAILATGRRSKAPPGGSTPQRPPAAPARAPEVDRSIGLALMRYVPDLLRWARRCGVSASDAPDVAQAALVRAWRSWERCEKPANERSGWLFGIVARVASTHVRAPKLRIELRDPDELTEAPDGAPLADESIEERGAVVTLEELRAGTTPERWRVFFAFEVEGLKSAAIAKREAAPIGTVHNRLRLARRDVRAVVQRHQAKLVHAESSARRKREKGAR